MTEEYLPFIKAILQIGILAFLFYMVLKALRRTRALTILGSVFAFLAIMQVLTAVFDLAVLRWLLERMISILPLFVLVTFQNEVRRVVTALVLEKDTSHQDGWVVSKGEESKLTHILSEIVGRFSESKTGALIALERKISLAEYYSLGRVIQAPLEDNLLLESIFYPGSPLHDGGVIINNGQIEAAGCAFPLCKNLEITLAHGMRHQAAVGLTENSDAVVIVVSEETGTVSLAVNGQLQKMVSPEQFRQQLNRYLVSPTSKPAKWWRRNRLAEVDGAKQSPSASAVASEEQGGLTIVSPETEASDVSAKLNSEV
ncbi:MAG: TIGR00159 family protein [Lentisphaerae bacterium]|jgi:diadenylate cyclase|nr:TIGR00159 family protein [Lentisphaerota bacterium]HQL86815.1 diadenylate cyclase CdaA [Lentisphaeria bacterium]